jgi:lactate dehydrogenase-like 2-hydroxyacid dehydrogenase
MGHVMVIGAPSRTARTAVTEVLARELADVSFWPAAEAVPGSVRPRVTGAIVNGPDTGSEFAASLPSIRAWSRVTGRNASYSGEFAALGARGVAMHGGPPGFSVAETAEFTVLMMLALVRRLGEAEAAGRSRDRERIESVTHASSSLRDERVGIVGLGRIGRVTAEVVGGFGATLVHAAARDRADCCAASGGRYGEHLSLGDTLASSGLVSVHLRDRPGGWRVDREFLAAMRPGAILVNTAQGSLVDEEALLDALASGHLAGAGLDVFAGEPLASEALLVAPNVLLTPHVAGKTVGVGRRIWRAAAQALLAMDTEPGPGCPAGGTA